MQGHRDLEIVNEFIIAQQTGCLNSWVLACPQMTPSIYLVFINLPKLQEKGQIKSDLVLQKHTSWKTVRAIKQGILTINFSFTKPDDSL